jgi:hypothetical protein
MALVVCIVSFAVTMAFQWISQILDDPSTSLVLRWVAGTLLVLGVIDGLLLFICVAIRSINQNDSPEEHSS